ncbi:hypothetical protein [Treponema sp. R6D11]
MTNNENFTAENIFDMIDNQSVSKDGGVKLIENYGIRKQREIMNSLQEDFPASKKIMEAIERINNQLDEMLKSITGVEN